MGYSKAKRKEIIDKLIEPKLLSFKVIIQEYEKHNVVFGYRRPNSNYINPLILSLFSWEFHDTSNCGMEFDSIYNFGEICDTYPELVYENINIIDLKAELKFLEGLVFVYNKEYHTLFGDD